jgi:hypothetical protein
LPFLPIDILDLPHNTVLPRSDAGGRSHEAVDESSGLIGSASLTGRPVGAANGIDPNFLLALCGVYRYHSERIYGFMLL